MSKKLTWYDYLMAFTKFTATQLALPVIIGGERKCYDFKGFQTVGEKYSRPMTGLEVLRLLQGLTYAKLQEEVPNGEFFGDKFGVGLNRVHLSHYVWDHKDGFNDDHYNILQDYINEDIKCIPTDDEAIELYKKDTHELTYQPCNEHLVCFELVRPETRIVIEVIDGACMLKDDDYIMGNN